MLKVFAARLHQKHRTQPFPSPRLVPLDRFRGVPRCDFSRCGPDCGGCRGACPTGALSSGEHGLQIDLGKCLFCGECARSCTEQRIQFTTDYRTCSRSRDHLIVGNEPLRRAEALGKKLTSLLGRSLKLRQVSAGGCNACEADTNVLGTPVFDLARFGIQFVASPRHADGVLVTGPVSDNMKLALEKTWRAIPSPKIVIAVGACAISGGPFGGHVEVHDGVGDILPVDLYVPGCPPHPLSILDGLLRMLGRID